MSERQPMLIDIASIVGGIIYLTPRDIRGRYLLTMTGGLNMSAPGSSASPLANSPPL
jgi:hypothetical protein